MAFNDLGMSSGNKYQAKEVKRVASENGYNKIPKVIFWNLVKQKKTPKISDADENGIINISGFSSKVFNSMAEILAGDKPVSTDTAMLDLLTSERYNYV
jgi:hypothetical protein